MRALLVAMVVGSVSMSAQAEDWTIQGKTYHNVEVQNVTDDHVEITFDGGVGSPKLADLSPDLQKRFHYGVPQDTATTAAVAAIKRDTGFITTIKIGDTDIQLSEPPGLVELPANDPMCQAAKDLTPPNCLLLRSCISAAALEHPDAATPIAFAQTFAIKDVAMDVPSGAFIDFVTGAARVASHGVLEAKDDFNDEETQKRLEAYQKDTGVKVGVAGNLYSLGVASRSDACVAYMTAQDVNMTFKGKTERNECLSIIAYLLLKKKVVVVVTSMTKPLFYREDTRTLKVAAEKYQLALQLLNNE